MAAEKKLHVGVRIGQGEPPGYKWNALYLTVSRERAMEHLDECQYHHMADQVKTLAYQDDPTHSDAVDVAKVEDFYEVSDKGGVLKNLNMRVFFAVYSRSKTDRDIVVLDTIKKEDDGKTAMVDIVRVRRRKREYEEGKYGRLGPLPS